MILLCLTQPAFGQGQAQWVLDVNGYYPSYVLNAPLGSKPVPITAMFGYPSAEYDTGVQPVTLSQDSIQGDGFTPETGGEFGNFNHFNFAATYSFVYTPKYEDTSITLITATSAAPPYSQQVRVVAITVIAASSEYSLSRSDFGVLTPGDTSQAELLLFNQTPDSERIYLSFSKGVDFNFLDSLSLPIIIPPGDSLPPIRLDYRANALRPSSSDSLLISIQRIRGGVDYHSPILFGNLLIGGCNAKYFELSKTKFGYITVTDSSTGTLKLFNPTEDTEDVSFSIIPQGDFEADEGVDSPILILPYDSSLPVRITMHTSINRKAIRDTLQFSYHWHSNGPEIAQVKFDTLISGGCSDLRFLVDSTYKHFVSTLGKRILDSVIVHNLTTNPLSLYTLFWIETEDFDDPYYNFNFGDPQVIPPLGSVAEIFSFIPSKLGYQHAGLKLTNWYIGTGDSNDTADVVNVSLEGLGLPPDNVSSVKDGDGPVIYPNPSASEFRIQGMKSGSFFVIYNALGIPIFQSRKDQFIWEGRDNSGNLCSSGHYFAAVIGHRYHYVISILLVR